MWVPWAVNAYAMRATALVCFALSAEATVWLTLLPVPPPHPPTAAGHFSPASGGFDKAKIVATHPALAGLTEVRACWSMGACMHVGSGVEGRVR